jgi:DNA-binding GntR family transcriptional regulator
MNAKLGKIRKRPSYKEEAYQRIKTLILSDELRDGDPLDIDWLASELGISRTPVREALLMLEQEGLIETIPYKGTFITDLTKKDVEEIYRVREGLESLAVELATPLIPDADLQNMQEMFAAVGDEIEEGSFDGYFESDIGFHDLLIRHSGNQVLQQVLDTLSGRIYRVRAFSWRRSGSHMQLSFAEHRAILDAIVERDVERAKELMARHVRDAGRRIADLIPDDPQ